MTPSGVPQFSIWFTDGPEDVASLSAQTSIFAGQFTPAPVWKLTMAEMLERCIFCEHRNAGFYVIDSERLAISHFASTGEIEAQTMSDAIHAAGAELTLGYQHYHVAVQSANGALGQWVFSREQHPDPGIVLSDQIVRYGGPISIWESTIRDAIEPKPTLLSFADLFRAIDAAMNLFPFTKRYVLLADQRTQVVFVYSCDAFAASWPDFTVHETTGNPLLIASHGFRAVLQPV